MAVGTASSHIREATMTTTPITIPKLLGAPIKRGEDPKLVAGAGSYVEDVPLTGLVHLAFVRSPHAHARLGRIDTAAARAAEGVLAVVTGAGLQGAFTGPLPCEPPGNLDEMRNPERLPLARDKVR